MKEPTPAPALEQGLIDQIAQLERQIAALTREQDALRRLLHKVRVDLLSRADVTRRNSYDRIVIENTILQVLRGASKPLRSFELYSRVTGFHPKLNQSTLRSYCRRMKERGLIDDSGGVGRWLIVSNMSGMDQQ